jgi:hypothetical protein
MFGNGELSLFCRIRRGGEALARRELPSRAGSHNSFIHNLRTQKSQTSPVQVGSHSFHSKHLSTSQDVARGELVGDRADVLGYRSDRRISSEPATLIDDPSRKFTTAGRVDRPKTVGIAGWRRSGWWEPNI